jgi:hypothetical protein
MLFIQVFQGLLQWKQTKMRILKENQKMSKFKIFSLIIILWCTVKIIVIVIGSSVN